MAGDGSQDLVAFLATINKPTPCSDTNQTVIQMNQTFACEVTAEEDGEAALFVTAIGYTDHMTVDDFCPTAKALMRVGSTSLFSAPDVPFRSPIPSGDAVCRSTAPYAPLKVKVWPWFRDLLNPTQPKLGAPAILQFCGKCQFPGPGPGPGPAPAPEPAPDVRSVIAGGVTPSAFDLEYRHVSARELNFMNGVRLDLAPGAPLRGSIVNVYATDVRWNYAPGPGHLVTSPLGTSAGPAGMAYRFPLLPPHALVIFQLGREPQVIEGTSPETAIEYEASPDLDIYVHVNDFWLGTSDNAGTFSIRVRVPE